MPEGIQFPKATMNSVTIENRRAILRQAYQKNPTDQRLKDALIASLAPAFIQRASKRGVFICYNRTDELFALDITTELRKHNIQAFMDEIDITDDLEWGKMVGHALRGCGVMVLILSPEALKDAEVQTERIFFLTSGKVVIGVKAHPCDHSNQQLMLAPLDCTKDNFETSIATLIALLKDNETAPIR